MKISRRIFSIFPIVSAFSPAQAGQVPNQGPIPALANLIRLVDRHQFPSWASPEFYRVAKALLTPDLIATIKRGGAIAKRRKIDLFDGDIVTYSGMVSHAALFGANVARQVENDCIVNARVGVTEGARPMPPGLSIQYHFRKIDGRWLLDDVKLQEQGLRSVKAIFANAGRAQ